MFAGTTGSSKRRGAELLPTGRIASGFRRGTCAAAAGRCRSRRFPWPRLAQRKRAPPGAPVCAHSTEPLGPESVALLRMDECVESPRSAPIVVRHRSAPADRAARRPQSRAARRRHAAGRARADPRRRRLGQDPRADDPHRLADPDRPGLARRRAGRDLHQQGGQGDADAARRDAADPRARHVGRHLPRPVQPLPARALEARRRCRRASRSSTRSDQLSAVKRVDQGDEPRRGALSRPSRSTWFIAGAKEDGLRAEGRRGRSDEQTARWSQVYEAYEAQCQREGVVDFAELMLRTYELLRDNDAAARALPAALPPHPGRRVPGHQPAAVRLAEDVRRPAEHGCALLRGRRRRPEHLRLSRRAGRQHGRRSSASSGSRTVIKLEQNYRSLRQHPRRRQRADRAQLAPPGQEPAHRGRARASRCACYEAPTDFAEAQWFVEESAAAASRRHAARNEIALLYRSNAQSRVMESALFNAAHPVQASTAACASSSAPRSSTRWPTCA